MAKVKEILGSGPDFQINEFAGDPIDPNKIWANYDVESDSVIIFLTGEPQPSISVYTDNNFYIMVDPKDRKVIGFHVENWEKSFVPAHTDIEAAWSPIKKAKSESEPWETLMRMLALWTIFVLRSESGLSPAMQPA